MATINNSKNAAAALKHLYVDEDIEKVYIALLDAGREIISTHLIAMGAESSVTMSRKKVARTALINNATAVIMVHNHPSDNVKPSNADVKMTNELKNILDICDIPLYDHIVMGKTKFFSFTDDTISNF